MKTIVCDYKSERLGDEVVTEAPKGETLGRQPVASAAWTDKLRLRVFSTTACGSLQEMPCNCIRVST